MQEVYTNVYKGGGDMGVELLERETVQATCLHDGRSQLETASFDVAPLGAHRPDQAMPHELRFTPTGSGLLVAAIDISSGDIVGDALIDPNNNVVRLSHGYVSEIGGLSLGVVTSDITTIRSIDADLEEVDDFTLDDLRGVDGLQVELGNDLNVQLTSLADEMAQIDVAMGRIRYWRKLVPTKDLGKRIIQGAEDHKLGTTLTTLGISAGTLAVGLYLKHLRNKN
jgi:hypothetical protein